MGDSSVRLYVSIVFIQNAYKLGLKQISAVLYADESFIDDWIGFYCSFDFMKMIIMKDDLW